MRKPGYKTSEFWFTLVSFIFSGLYLAGLLNDNSQKEELISNVSHAVESCILISGQFAILYKYITSRKQTKIEYEKTKQLELEEESKKNSEPVSIGEMKDEQQRTNNTRSRKANNKSKKQPSKRKTSSNKRSVEDSSSSNSKHNTNNRKTGNRPKKS